MPSWISNNIHYKVWDEITSPFPNFNGATVEVWKWRSNFIPHFTGYVITYPCWDLCWIYVSKRDPVGWRNIGYASETHLKLKFCTEHGSIITVLHTKCQNDLTTEQWIMDERNFAMIEFKMSFGRTPYILKAPCFTVLVMPVSSGIFFFYNELYNKLPDICSSTKSWKEEFIKPL